MTLYSRSTSVTADVLTADVEAITGASPANKTLADLNTALTALRSAKTIDDIVAELGPYKTAQSLWKATVTTSSQTLAEMKGSALLTGLKQIVIVPSGADPVVFYAAAEATTSSPKFPVNGMATPIDETLAGAWEFITDADTEEMMVLELS